jgi:hypothetical protein
MEGRFRLLRQTRKWGLMVEVGVRVDPAAEREIVIDPDVFVWRREVYGPEARWGGPCDDALCVAAEEGVRYALECLPDSGGNAHVRVTNIWDSPADTTAPAVKFAAAYATWRAMGHEPTTPPYIDQDGQAVFPG